MAQPQIVLYIDIVSPFAYMAFHILRTSPVFSSVARSYVPCFLPAIISHCGGTPPAKVKNKGPYFILDRLRWCELFAIPMHEQMPPDFPQNSLLVQRALCAVALDRRESVEECMAALYHASFVNREDVFKEEGLRVVLEKVLGAPAAKEVVERCRESGAKSLLQENTAQVLAEGGFGLPWMTATNAAGETKHFWGFDHLGQVCGFLGLETPTTRERRVAGQEGGWKAML